MNWTGPPPRGDDKGILLIGNFHSHVRGSAGVIEQLAAALERNGWRVHPASRSTGRLGRLADMLRTAWSRRHRYGIAQVDVYSGNAFIWAETVCRLLETLGKPYVLALRGGNLPVFARGRGARIRRLFAKAAAVTAPSPYLVKALAEYAPSGIACIPNAIDLGKYPFAVRRGVPPRLVWLRRLHAIYDPAMAIETVALLAPEFPEIRLSMVGAEETPGMMAEMKQLAARRGVERAVEFVGGVAKHEVGKRIAGGSIFLNTAAIDNTPVTLLEAMACGVPIVSTWAGGVPDLVAAGEDALLVAPGDAPAMAAAVKRLLTDPALCGKLSENGRAKAETFDWPRVFPLWEELFERLHGTA